jgi:DNA/RNA endonuclease YhcR with UshA esterase domain
MIRAFATSLVLAATVLHPVPASAHHSNVAYEVTKVITITGVVKSFEWVNPHTWLTVVVDDGKGGKVEWACEGRAPGILTRAGWTRNILKAGEMVTVDMSPAKDGSKVSIIARVTKADGTILSNQPQFDPRTN